jgi:hypothetical protein
LSLKRSSARAFSTTKTSSLRPVAVEQRDEAHRHVEVRAGRLGEGVEGRVGRRIQNAGFQERSQALLLVRPDRKTH